MTVVSMKSHVYKFGGKLRIQGQGGPIGLGLTGDVADCAMVDWDKKLIEKLKKLGIHSALYKRFKDDITIMLEILEKGTDFKEGELQIDEAKKKRDEVIREIANSNDPVYN